MNLLKNKVDGRTKIVLDVPNQVAVSFAEAKFKKDLDKLGIKVVSSGEYWYMRCVLPFLLLFWATSIIFSIKYFLWG